MDIDINGNVIQYVHLNGDKIKVMTDSVDDMNKLLRIVNKNTE